MPGDKKQNQTYIELMDLIDNICPAENLSWEKKQTGKGSAVGKEECSLELGDVEQNADVEAGCETPTPLPLSFISSGRLDSAAMVASA